MKKFAIAIIALAAFSANADEIPRSAVLVDNSQGFSYGGYKEHAMVSALLGIGCKAQLFPNSNIKAFGCAMVPGVIKEIIDSRQKGNYFSGKDLAYDALGAALGVGIGNVFLSYQRGGVKAEVSIPLQ